MRLTFQIGKAIIAISLLSTTVIAQTNFLTPELKNDIADATIVVEGRITSDATSRYSDSFHEAETVHFIDVVNVLKGSISPNSSISIVTFGGVIDGKIYSVPHSGSLNTGEYGLFLLDPTTINGEYVLHKGNNGKYLKITGERHQAIQSGTGQEYSSWRIIREDVAKSLGHDLLIKPLQKQRFSAVTQDKEFCVKLDNPEPNFENSTVEFDVMAKSNVQGLKFGRADVLITYPTGNLGGFIVDQEKIEAEKSDITDSPAYTIEVADKQEDQIELSIESPCDNNEPHYVLDTVYEKLATLTVEVEDWGDFGTMNVDEFTVDGEAEYVNPSNFQETQGCTPFDDLCGEGDFNFLPCNINPIVETYNAGIGDILEITGTGFGIDGNGASVETPNAEFGGLSNNIMLGGLDRDVILSWSDTLIRVNVSSQTFAPVNNPDPVSSGIWKVHPKPDTTSNSMSCETPVEIGYSVYSKLDSNLPNGTMKERRFVYGVGVGNSLNNPTTNQDGILRVELDRSINSSAISSILGFDSAGFEPILRRVICNWQDASGIDIEYTGLTPVANMPDREGIVTISFGATGGDLAFTPITLDGSEFCQFPYISTWLDADMRIGLNGDWHIGSAATLPVGKYDLETVLLHEFGHVLLQYHANDLDTTNGTMDTRVMYYARDTGFHLRNIDPFGTDGGVEVKRSSANTLASSICQSPIAGSLLDTTISVNDTCNTSSSVFEIQQPEHCDMFTISESSIFNKHTERIRVMLSDISGRVLQTYSLAPGESTSLPPLPSQYIIHGVSSKGVCARHLLKLGYD